MMKTSQILKQAWHNVVNYRALWLFGMALALFTASLGTAWIFGPSEDEGQEWQGITIQRRDDETFLQAWDRAWNAESARFNRELRDIFEPWDIEPNVDLEKLMYTMVAVAVSFAILAAAVRYMSRVALIRMVDCHQQTGEKQTVRQGLRFAWSHQGWQLFMIELLANLAGIAASLLLMALVFGPLPLWVDLGETTAIAAGILTAALFFIAVFAIVMASLAITLIKLLARRVCVLEELGVAASLNRGYRLVRQHFRELLPVGLVGLAVNLSWPAVVGCFLILLFGIGVLVGGLPALVVGKLMELASAGETAVFVALGLGLLLLGAILTAPLIWLDGMRQVFLSSLWTLTFREVQGMASVEGENTASQARPETSAIPQGASGQPA
jgi:hypothetical protein